MDKMDNIDKKLDDLTEVVVFIKDRMATKEALKKFEDHIGGRVEGIGRRLDDELDKRKQLEVRTAKLETKVFAK